MEVINSNVASLSNFEVMNHLQNLKGAKKKSKGQLATITYETLRFLENTPCKYQTPDSIRDCLKALKPYNLTKNEKLMIINAPPTTPLEIQLMIEESEERLSEEQVEEILQIVANHFPHIRKEVSEVDEENQETT